MKAKTLDTAKAARGSLHVPVVHLVPCVEWLQRLCDSINQSDRSSSERPSKCADCLEERLLLERAGHQEMSFWSLVPPFHERRMTERHYHPLLVHEQE